MKKIKSGAYPQQPPAQPQPPAGTPQTPTLNQLLQSPAQPPGGGGGGGPAPTSSPHPAGAHHPGGFHPQQGDHSNRPRVSGTARGTVEPTRGPHRPPMGHPGMHHPQYGMYHPGMHPMNRGMHPHMYRHPQYNHTITCRTVTTGPTTGEVQPPQRPNPATSAPATATEPGDTTAWRSNTVTTAQQQTPGKPSPQPLKHHQQHHRHIKRYKITTDNINGTTSYAARAKPI